MKIIHLIPLLIVTLIAVACTEDPQPTPTVIPPTQTPIIITATPLPATATPLPTATFTVTPTATITPTLASASADDEDDSEQDTPQPARPVSNFKPNCTPRQDWQTYTIVVGDTLGRLATQTDSALTTLANANCLINPNIIAVGQTLRVPQQPDKGDDPAPIIEDLISMFNINQTSATPGELITLSWTADDGTVISIVNTTLNTTIIGNNLGDTGSLGYTIPVTVDPDTTTAITFTINGQLERDGEMIFANSVKRTISIESPPDCDDSGATDTTDDDCEDPACDDSGATDTTDDDCDEPACDDSGATDTTDDDCEVPACDDSGATDTTDDDCEDPACDDTGATDTTDDDCDDPACDDSGATDTTDDDCEDDTSDDDSA